MTTKPTSFSLDEHDRDRLDAVCEKLHLSRSRVVAIAVAFLFTMSVGKIEEMKECLHLVKKPAPQPVEKKKCGWPKGRKRGPRKPKVVPLKVVSRV